MLLKNVKIKFQTKYSFISDSDNLLCNFQYYRRTLIIGFLYLTRTLKLVLYIRDENCCGGNARERMYDLLSNTDELSAFLAALFLCTCFNFGCYLA